MQDDAQQLLHSGSRASACSTSLNVAGLRLSLDARESGLSISAPPAHARFASADDRSDLALVVRAGRLSQAGAWRPLCTACDAWQLWQDAGGHYVFAGGHASGGDVQVTVDDGFRSGEVLVAPDGRGRAGHAFYPLADIDVILLVNWLAGFGDLILHASGVAYEGRGYCFAGVSGAGKSTLAAAFMASGLTVLGEDNLVLRYLEGRFWIFGTPWHRDPAACSPDGVPLEKLFFLDRTAAPGVARLPPVRGTELLLQTAFVPYYRPAAVATILDRLALLAERVPFYTLSHRLGADVMALVRDA